MGLRELPAYRPPTRTKYSREEAADILLQSLSEVDANGEQLRIIAAILLSQADFETGGFSACWNHNWGNLRCGGAGTAAPFTLIPGPVDENIDGRHVVASGEEDPLRVFRAYDSPLDGCRAWVGLIRTRYPWAWEYLLGSADSKQAAAQFVRCLADPTKPRQYYTANRERYAAGVAARYDACRKAVWGEP